jgi:hypothetical protein
MLYVCTRAEEHKSTRAQEHKSTRAQSTGHYAQEHKSTRAQSTGHYALCTRVLQHTAVQAREQTSSLIIRTISLSVIILVLYPSVSV